MALIGTLVDNFNNGVDTSNWSKTSSVVASNGQITVSHTATGGDYKWIATQANYDLTGSFAHVQITDFGDQTIVQHESDIKVQKDGSNYLLFAIRNGFIAAVKVVAGTPTQIGSSLALDYTNHRWIRIRESGGTTFWDTAPDGTTWTNRWSTANPFAITSLQFVLITGSNTNETAGSHITWDNFNCGGSISSFSDNFNNGISNWNTSGSGDATQVVNRNGGVYITHTAASQYNQLVGNTLYDWTSSAGYVQVLDFGDQSQANHIVCFEAIDTGGGANRIIVQATNGNLQAWKWVSNVQTQIGSNIALDQTNHRWLRIRESGGTTFWDTAPDGVNWTNRWSAANPITMTALYPLIVAGTSGDTNPNSGAFDNFNCPEPSPFSFKPTMTASRYVGPGALRKRYAKPNIKAPRRRTDDFFN